MSDHLAFFLAQAAAPAPATPAPADSGGSFFFMIPVFFALFYFAFIRPQSQAKKKQEELLKTAKTGDRIVTTGGIHGVIANVKDSTVIVKVADAVKLEIEKAHIDKLLRPEATEAEKITVTKS